MIIQEVSAKKIKDSRGNEAIEVSVNGSKASSPNGKSVGSFETKSFYGNIDNSVDFFNRWERKIAFSKFGDLINIERIIGRLVGGNAKKIGANALYAFESAILKAFAKHEGVELWEVINPGANKFPIPIGNVVGGGLHNDEDLEKPDFQEFLIIPRDKSFEKNVKIMKSVYDSIGKDLKAKEKNDEGAWVTEKDNEEVIDALNSSRFSAKKKFGVPVSIGLDVAANSFYESERYQYKEKNRNKAGQLKYMTELVKNFAVGYLEDPFVETDFQYFSKLNSNVQSCLIVGDDLTASKIERLGIAKQKGAINSMIIKPNQNGSLVELRKLFEICRKKKIKTILSHRSGETMDNALADYAFGFGADYIKAGVSTKWREAKLKRMTHIEKELEKFPNKKPNTEIGKFKK